MFEVLGAGSDSVMPTDTSADIEQTDSGSMIPTGGILPGGSIFWLTLESGLEGLFIIHCGSIDVWSQAVNLSRYPKLFGNRAPLYPATYQNINK